MLDGDPKSILRINFTGNLDRYGNAIIEEVKETNLDFSKGNVRLLRIYFALI